MTETFSQFKERFYSAITDFSVFDCEEYNLLKVVLDGLKVDYKAKGINNQAIFKNQVLTDLIFFAKRVKYKGQINIAQQKSKQVSKKLNVPYFFFDNGRIAKNNAGEEVSFYFDKIENYLEPKNCVTIYQVKTRLKNGECINDLVFATLFASYSKEDKVLIKKLKQAYSNIENLKIFTAPDLFNIRVAINKFFDEFRFWNFMLKNASVKIALFDEHYHREAFLLALQRKKIKTVELQHGLIAPEDLFYVFPKNIQLIASRALFPDKIFTYGSYWSEILKKGFEFKPSQITELGVYQELNTYVDQASKDELAKFINSDAIILVTTQTFLHNYFIDYVKWLSDDLIKQRSPIKIIVKNHPSEKAEDYKVLRSLRNVKVANINTEYLLSISSWHVSCYSTTLYDATKYNCHNFSLLIPQCEDYIETFIKEGISYKLLKDQNPATMKTHAKEFTFDKKTLYEDFEIHKHKLKEIQQI